MDNKQLLADLISHPEKVEPAHVSVLLEMIAEFPYAQPIYSLLARIDKGFVSKAALYSNQQSLYNLIHIAPKEVDYEFVEQLDEEPKKELIGEEQEIFEEIGEVPQITPTENEVETPKNLPGIDQHLLDYSADENEALISSAFLVDVERNSSQVPDAPIIETVIPDVNEVNFVSRYDDKELPYSFLWWLAKTRKEHEQIFQPYAQPKPQIQKHNHNQSNPEFQQQYVEHIFHIQTPFDVTDHLAEHPPKESKDAKGAKIIERFLKEDPIIKPPKPEQVNNENKAKKSAEDNYDLVSETLAKIYIEQMLYHKAIDTYKKLSLKYPEKSRYFADLIQSIEKKL